MAQVSGTFPFHTESGTDRIRWSDLANGFADVASLLAVPGEGHVVRIEVRGNQQDTSNRVQVRVTETPNGGIGNDVGPELNDDWETGSSSLTISAAGIFDLVLAGPNNPNVLTRDTTEPYSWIPGQDYDNGSVTFTYSVNNQPAGLAAWVIDFKAAYAADNTLRASFVLDDGGTLDLQTLSAEASISEPNLLIPTVLELSELSAQAAISEPSLILDLILSAQALSAEASISEPSLIIAQTLELSTISSIATISRVRFIEAIGLDVIDLSIPSITFTPLKIQTIDVSAFQIELTNSSRQTVILTPSTAESAILVVWWSEQVKHWFFDLTTEDNKIIVNGKLMIQRAFLVRSFSDLFQGDLYITGPLTGEPPIRTSWTEGLIYKLHYVPPGVVETLREKFPWL